MMFVYGKSITKMGVTLFNKFFVSHQVNVLPKAYEICKAIFIDGNTLPYEAFAILLKTLTGSYDQEGEKIIVKNLDEEELWEQLKKSMELSIDKDVIQELVNFQRLEELYVMFDGIPCWAKIQNQKERRKRREAYYVLLKSGERRFVFDKGMIIQGTPMMDMFVEVFQKKIDEFIAKNKEQGRSISSLVSPPSIPGEGEHKILDYLRVSKFSNRTANLEDEEGNAILIWGNDSDIVVSLLHQPYYNVFFYTTIAEKKIARHGFKEVPKQRGCVRLSDIRSFMCSNPRETLNAPLLVAFLGNDYLPAMLNTRNIDVAYKHMRDICQVHLTREDVDKNQEDIKNKLQLNVRVDLGDKIDLDGNDDQRAPVIPIDLSERTLGGTRIIDFDALRLFLKAITAIEISLIQKDVLKWEDELKKKANNTIPRFHGEAKTITDWLELKRRYYTHVYKLHYEYMSQPASSSASATSGNFKEPNERELFEFEIQMALAFFKTFTWYFYYQSGYRIGEISNDPNALQNVYYPYSHPPLFNSLYIILNETDLSQRLRPQFDFTFNPEHRPLVREQDYFSKLPDFKFLHWYMIFPRSMFEALCKAMMANDDKKLAAEAKKAFETMRDKHHDSIMSKPTDEDRVYATRYINTYYTIYDRVDIPRLLAEYKDFIKPSTGSIITHGQVAQVKGARKMDAGLYPVMRNEAVYPEFE